MKLSILTCFILYSTFVLAKVNANGNTFAVDTENEYKYHVWNEDFKEKDEICVTFTVQANNDVHIGFFDDYADAYEAPMYDQTKLPNMYEVVIGGWGDTKSVIRDSAQGGNYKPIVKSEGWLNKDQQYKFWVNLKKNSKEISVGGGGVAGRNIITTAVLQERHDTGYVGFSTGWGSTGQWTDIQECQPASFSGGSAKDGESDTETEDGESDTEMEDGEEECPTLEKLETENKYKYELWDNKLSNKQGAICLTFNVQANNDAHIAFFNGYTPDGYTQSNMPPEMYEVVLGGWSGNQSVLRQSSQGLNLDENAHGRIHLDKTKSNPFWIKIEEEEGGHNTLLLGSGDVVGERIIVEADASRYESKYVGFSSGWGSSAIWTDIKECCDKSSDEDDLDGGETSEGDEDDDSAECASWQLDTMDKYEYKIWDHKLTGGDDIVLLFDVQAKNDAHIGFFETNQVNMQKMYEVVLGGWGGNQSVLRESSQGANLAAHWHGKVHLKEEEPKPFWIKISKNQQNGRTVSLGSGTDVDSEIIVEADMTNYDIKYVGISSGWGSTAKWSNIRQVCLDTPISYQAGGVKSAKQELQDTYHAGGAKSAEQDVQDTYHAADSKSDTQRGQVETASNVGVSGDPHFKTWTGDKYDYHGICDLVLLSHPGFLEGVGMQINVRSQKTKSWSYISTAVVHIGTEIFEVAGIKGGNTSWLNSIEVTNDKWEHDMATINGYPIKYERLHTESRGYVIDLGNNESIQIKTWKNMVRVNVIDNPKKQQQQGTFDGSLGLMGSYPKGIMLGRDGETEIAEVDNFGQEWQVLSSEPMFFHNTDGPQHPSKCEKPSKQVLRRRLSKSKVSRQDAENACAQIGAAEDELDLCIFDVMAIGDVNAAGAY